MHRGPDDAGYLIDGDFGFGMRRLSIIDVQGGHQPISSADGRYAIVCNGEIVNHLQLREELGASYSFQPEVMSRPCSPALPAGAMMLGCARRECMPLRLGS